MEVGRGGYGNNARYTVTEVACGWAGATVWRPKNKVLSEKIFFDDFDQERMHRSTLMHIYKFLLSLDRSELMCEHPLCNKEITSDSFICCDSQRFNFIFTMTDWLPPDHSHTHTHDALSCAFSFKASYELKTNLSFIMRVTVTATVTKSSEIASSKRFFIQTDCVYPIWNILQG